MNIKYLFKDKFAVIGKAGRGAPDNKTRWINSLWGKAGINYNEIENLTRKDENNGAFWWGLMDGVSVSVNDPIKYMVGCEVNLDATPPIGWEKRTIPAQTYIVAGCTPDTTSEVFEKIKSDSYNHDNSNIKFIGEGYEHYPNPGDNSIVEVYCPIADGMFLCKSCAMPMTKPEDFGKETGASLNSDFCRYCYNYGALREGVTMEELIADIQTLADIEAEHPNLLNDALFDYIKSWLPLDEAQKKVGIPALLTALIDGQDCDFTGTQWEKEWLSDGKICHCIACVSARKCISDIKIMMGRRTLNTCRYE